MKIQVLKNEDYQDVENLPKKATDRATGFDVVTTSGRAATLDSKYLLGMYVSPTFQIGGILLL